MTTANVEPACTGKGTLGCAREGKERERGATARGLRGLPNVRGKDTKFFVGIQNFFFIRCNILHNMLNVRISQRSRLLVPTSGLRLRCSRQSLGKGGRATIKVTRSHKRKGRKKSPGQTFFLLLLLFLFSSFLFFFRPLHHCFRTKRLERAR